MRNTWLIIVLVMVLQVVATAEENASDLLVKAIKQCEREKVMKYCQNLKSNPSVVKVISEMVTSSEKKDVRRQALWSLGLLETPEAAQALATLFPKLKEEAERQTALCALRDNGSPGSAEFLKSCVKDKTLSNPLRTEAVDALARLRGKAGLQSLTELSQDKKTETVVLACRGLGQVNDTKAFKRLDNLLSKSSPDEVRKAAANSLAALPSSKHEKAAKILLKALKNEKNPAVLEAMLGVLGVVGKSSDVSKLKRLAERRPAQIKEMFAQTINMLTAAKPVLSELDKRLAKSKKLLGVAPKLTFGIPKKRSDTARIASAKVIILLSRYKGLQDKMSPKQVSAWRENLLTALELYADSFLFVGKGESVGHRDGLNRLKAAEIGMAMVSAKDARRRKKFEQHKKFGKSLVDGTYDHHGRRPGQIW